jgi:hypothetical protein
MRKIKHKIKERKLTLFFPPFNNYEVCVITSNQKERSAEKIFDRHQIEHDTDGFGAIHIWCNRENRPISYMVFPEDASVGTITHECWHCIKKMFSWIGSDYEDEIVAYHLDYLVQEVFDFIHQK